MKLDESSLRSTEFIGFVSFFLAATGFLFTACLVKEMCSVEIFLAWGGLVFAGLVNMGWVRGKNKKIMLDLNAKKFESTDTGG